MHGKTAPAASQRAKGKRKGVWQIGQTPDPACHFQKEREERFGKIGEKSERKNHFFQKGKKQNAGHNIKERMHCTAQRLGEKSGKREFCRGKRVPLRGKKAILFLFVFRLFCKLNPAYWHTNIDDHLT